MKRLSGITLLISLLTTAAAFGNSSNFSTGPVFSEFGAHAPVPEVSIAPTHMFKVAFDVATSAKPGQANEGFDSLARFINMHVANGSKLDNIQLALVVHGTATLDVIKHSAYKQKKGSENPSQALVSALLKHNVKVVVCGQSSAANNVTPAMLIEGVEMDLSAMTAHARLSEQGFSVNPF
ncbi:DsrE family protein [Salinimonas sediminis]|uniref:Uncharacterized protein n=1 Tax=Salinimonas sediminis TaxID=2303538 RepID=A0A346NPI5_9ALTE|nr:DsrE family protein [Salinimonas sediminis]AXR07442.1 hypothetical protein D0Y50_14430 [Salinimonas sediminis]